MAEGSHAAGDLLGQVLDPSLGRTAVARQHPADQLPAPTRRVLRAGGIVALLGDQSAGRKGCWVKFFDRPASTHKAVAVLALGAEAPLLVSYARRNGPPLHYELGIAGVADPRADAFAQAGVASLAQWYADCLEGCVRQSPNQYWWLHRRWKGTPPPAVQQRFQAA